MSSSNLKTNISVEDLVAAIEQSIERTLEDVGDSLVEKAVRLVPVDTGNLMKSINSTAPEEEDDKYSILFRAQAPYAANVEFGTAPHVIEPKDAKALRFKRGDQVVFARKVHHPGTQPQPYMRPAIDIVGQDIKPMLNRHLKTALATKGVRLVR